MSRPPWELGERVLAVLTELAGRGQTVAVAESCTGGGLGAALTSVPGASRVFVGGVIAYSNGVKCELLGVSPAVLEAAGAVSSETAAAMATGARKMAGADWGVSTTGIAGPGGGDEGKPVGTVWIGVAGPGREAAECERHAFTGDRAAIRSATVRAAVDLLARTVRDARV